MYWTGTCSSSNTAWVSYMLGKYIVCRSILLICCIVSSSSKYFKALHMCMCHNTAPPWMGLFYFAVATPPENITGVRDCPFPWRLSFHRATDKVWNITHYEVVYWEREDDNETTTVNITVESSLEMEEFELDLAHLELDREFLFTIRSHSVEGPGDLSGEFPVCTWRCREFLCS